MAIPEKYVNLELELQRRYFQSAGYETLDQIFDKYSVAYFDNIYSRRKPFLFKKVAAKFNDPEEYRRYITSLFLYHPDVKKTKDFAKINISSIDPSDKINAACWNKYCFHLDQLELGLVNDLEFINSYAQNINKTYDEFTNSSDLFVVLYEKEIRYESIAILERISPFLVSVFRNSSAIERMVYETVFRRVIKLSGLTQISEKSQEGVKKILVDTKAKF